MSDEHPPADPLSSSDSRALVRAALPPAPSRGRGRRPTTASGHSRSRSRSNSPRTSSPLQNAHPRFAPSDEVIELDDSSDDTSPAFTSLPRIPYNPETYSQLSTQFIQATGSYEEEGVRFVSVRLTYAGNRALFDLCHTQDQREVWRFPSYEFTIRKDSIRVRQASLFLPFLVCWFLTSRTAPHPSPFVRQRHPDRFARRPRQRCLCKEHPECFC